MPNRKEFFMSKSVKKISLILWFSFFALWPGLASARQKINCEQVHGRIEEAGSQPATLSPTAKNASAFVPRPLAEILHDAAELEAPQARALRIAKALTADSLAKAWEASKTLRKIKFDSVERRIIFFLASHNPTQGMPFSELAAGLGLKVRYLRQSLRNISKEGIILRLQQEDVHTRWDCQLNLAMIEGELVALFKPAFPHPRVPSLAEVSELITPVSQQEERWQPLEEAANRLFAEGGGTPMTAGQADEGDDRQGQKKASSKKARLKFDLLAHESPLLFLLQHPRGKTFDTTNSRWSKPISEIVEPKVVQHRLLDLSQLGVLWVEKQTLRSRIYGIEPRMFKIVTDYFLGEGSPAAYVLRLTSERDPQRIQ
ncbi:MAG: hypothetical protein C5B49_04230 [Bdellovibrio sp.]|nr:MAG: hypothetical protein C5B49_04230 [Bdellovibrio sp.]